MLFEGHVTRNTKEVFLQFKLYIIVINNVTINSFNKKKCKTKKRTFFKRNILRKTDIPKLFFLCFSVI